MILPRLALTAASLLATLVTAEAQDRQLTVYNGPVAIELPANLLRGSAPATTPAAEAPAVRKVRVIVASPYGN